MFLNIIFGNPVTRKVERKKMIDGEIEVLKKQQKVKFESTNTEFDGKESKMESNIETQITFLEKQIKILRANKKANLEILREERKVALDKVTNKFNEKITIKQNQSKKLGHLIDAEQKNIQDVINSDTPNAPTISKNNVSIEADKEIKSNTKKILNEKKHN